MRSIEQLRKNLLGIALLTAITAAGGQTALANTLSQVQVNAAESGYAVVLNTESPAHMKKVITSPDKMYIELKDIEAAEDLSTAYNDVANIENVTIQPSAKNGLRITLQGKDISSSKIYFENAKTLPTAEQSEESIELSGPVSSYRPVYNNRVEEVDQTASPRVNRVLTQMHIDRSMVLSLKNFLKEGLNDKNIMIAFGLLIIAAVFMFLPKKKSKKSLQIGLGAGLSTTTKSAQIQRELELAKGLMSAPASQSRPVAPANYGMKAYQNSQKNPYMTNNLAEHRSGVSGIPRKNSIPSRKPVSAPVGQAPVKKAPQMRIDTQTVSNMQNTIQSQAPLSAMQNQAKAANIDSVKFLESITRIYEKNGRTDLAKGLKDNLKKAQMVKQAI